MKNFIAIMAWDANNRISKFQDYDLESDALDHVALRLGDYPNAFVVAKPNDDFQSWLIDGVNKTISVDYPVIVPPTDAERIDAAFPQTDVARVIFEVFFEFVNEIRILKDTVNGTTQGAVTKSQFKDYLKTKLP